MGQPRYIHSPSQWVGQDISTPLPSGSAEIYQPPFRTGRPRYIHSPSQRVGQDITYPFRMGRPGYIHSPSQRVGRDISTPLQNRLAEISIPLHSGPAGDTGYIPPFTGLACMYYMLACSTAQVTLGWIALYYFSPSLCFTLSLQSAYVHFTKN